MMKKRIPRGYKEAFTTVYESKGRECSAYKELCLRCRLYAACRTNKATKNQDMYEAVKEYFEEQTK